MLFILRPYLGAGVSFGFSNVYGGVNGTVDVPGYGGTTQDFIDMVGSDLDIDTDGITFSGDYTEPSFRVFAGTSFSLFLLKLDLSATINPVTSALGAALNARIQL